MKKYTNTENNDLLGPGTDLIISLLGVLLMAVSIYAAKQGNIVKVKEYQEETIKRIAEKFPEGQYASKGENLYGIYIKGDTLQEPDILIHNDITLQRISFGEHILFKFGKPILKPGAENIIDKVSAVINITGNGVIEEINIHGHADSSGNEYANLKLGADRALRVFDIMTKQINPHQYLISASTFGEYKPTARAEKNTTWSKTKTKNANKLKQQRAKNRRTDIVLNYRENLTEAMIAME